MTDLAATTRYDPAQAEPRILERWLASGLFHPEPDGAADENYSIAIPPPNVTGALHMGHALNGGVQDTLIRYHRMRGRRVKWIFGTDHAGIATQRQVERALEDEGTSREQIGRAAFVERAWRWREQYGSRIVEQFKRLGASCDFAEENFTLDPAYARAVAHVFVALHAKGLIYRDRYMVNWDPGLRSAISDLEVEDREVDDVLYSIDYPLASGGGAITIATVRPETMLGDTAIAVHPDDERYSRLVGENAVLPLVGRRLRIIADPYAKPEFGTGALKITPGHDPNDFEIGRAHGLEQITVIGEDGCMTAAASERFAGLTALDARAAVVVALREQGLIVSAEPYRHMVPHSHRSGARVEPLISLQWFMRMDELAAPALAAARDGRVRFHPERWGRVYGNWLENIRPWCVSRQLWWGHQLPVWYRGAETHVGPEAPAGAGWERDPDVLDTWFSSALWPFATLGWPDVDDPRLRAFHPTAALSTARDILFLWVARMVMMGIEFTGEIPFHDVYVHSTIQAPDGRRMSKSLGTGIDPIDLIDGGERPPVFRQGGDFPAYGADAVRFGLLAMSSAQDVRFSEEKVEQGARLANKLWNASRFVLLGVGGDEGVVAALAAAAPPAPETIEDRWILSRLERAQADLRARLDAYDFAHAALGLYEFVYDELCDWYIELVKPRLASAVWAHSSDGSIAPPAIYATLLHVLRTTLTMAHPLIPFVTEAIWEHVPGAAGLLAGARLAAPSPARIDPVAEAAVERVIVAVQALRGWRAALAVSPRPMLPARLEAEGYGEVVEQIARLARLTFSGGGGGGGGGGAASASVPVPGGVIHILPTDAVDFEAAARKGVAERDRLAAEVARSEAKLGRPGFATKAPPPVVDAERAKLARLRAELEAL